MGNNNIKLNYLTYSRNSSLLTHNSNAHEKFGQTGLKFEIYKLRRQLKRSCVVLLPSLKIGCRLAMTSLTFVTN
jgi:hypothetical protein